MARNVRLMDCTPEDVFEVLANGWLYPAWVVGASRMRAVDQAWPNPGSRLHHSFGVWPILIDDSTRVEEYVPPRRMVLVARGWPVGEARVEIEVRPRGEGTVVRLTEHAISGPASWVPSVLLDPILHWRNTETLRRLAFLAESSTTLAEPRRG